jgi:hypothetical protein
MKFATSLLGFSLACVLFASQGDAQDKKPPQALAPHPLDETFAKGMTQRDLTNALLNAKIFDSAMKNALKAKQDAEQLFRSKKDHVGPSPAQAARAAFLRTLLEEKAELKKIEEKKSDNKTGEKKTDKADKTDK